MAQTGLRNGRIPGQRASRRISGEVWVLTGMVAVCEDLPEEHNTVTLDPTLTDSTEFLPPRSTIR